MNSMHHQYLVINKDVFHDKDIVRILKSLHCGGAAFIWDR